MFLTEDMRSPLLYLIFAISACVWGYGHHPKPAHQPNHARSNGTADDASKACDEIKSRISSASEVIDGVSKCPPHLCGPANHTQLALVVILVADN